MNRVYYATIHYPAAVLDQDGQIFVLYADAGNLDNVISGFRREVDQNCVLQGCYSASSGTSLPAFRDNLSVPSLGVVAY